MDPGGTYGRDHLVKPWSGVVGDGDLVHRVHNGFVGAAVQRALERADGSGDGAVDAREGGGDDARGEGGG